MGVSGAPTEQLNYFELAYEERNFSAAARRVPCSPQGLTKAIHALEKELGVTPHRYLVDKRLKMAAELLMTDANAGARTIGDIAPLCGFHDPLYFSKMFKKKYGIAPRYYLDYRLKGTPIPHDSDSVKVKL